MGGVRQGPDGAGLDSGGHDRVERAAAGGRRVRLGEGERLLEGGGLAGRGAGDGSLRFAGGGGGYGVKAQDVRRWGVMV